jgi:hypothetical protein
MTGERGSHAAVQAWLRRRGLAPEPPSGPAQLFVPRVRAEQEQFYRLLKHYSFRLFVRDVIKHRRGFVLNDLLHYCAAPVARRYLTTLDRLGLVAAVRHGVYRSTRPDVTSFGPTLEWFVARLLRQEYGCETAWNVRLAGAPHGGDYDVLAVAEGEAIYVETKSAPPRQITQAEVAAFLDRLTVLRPHLAIFLADTQLRMRDKIVELFRVELRQRRARVAVRRWQREIFRVGSRIRIVNSAPDLLHNLGACLAAHFGARAPLAVPAVKHP